MNISSSTLHCYRHKPTNQQSNLKSACHLWQETSLNMLLIGDSAEEKVPPETIQKIYQHSIGPIATKAATEIGHCVVVASVPTNNFDFRANVLALFLLSDISQECDPVERQRVQSKYKNSTGGRSNNGNRNGSSLRCREIAISPASTSSDSFASLCFSHIV